MTIAADESVVEGNALDESQHLGIGEIDLAETLDGGQAFRWHLVGDCGRYEGVIGDSVVGLRCTGGDVAVTALGTNAGDCGPIEAVTRTYLASGRDPAEMFQLFGDEPWARNAAAKRVPLRVLRQDPWECLAAFICSQNSNMPRIKQMVWSVASMGRALDPDGRYRAFPNPEVVADLGESRLRSLGLGYRAPHLVESAREVANSGYWLQTLRSASYADARLELMQLPGVGPKVADCVLAYSLDKPEAFPIDVHVMRAMTRLYELPDRMKTGDVAAWARDRFGEWSSLVQLYVFRDEVNRTRGHTPT